MNKKKLLLSVSSPWQSWLEHSLFPCLNVCPVNLTVAAEAVWKGCLIDGSALAGDTVCCLKGEQPDAEEENPSPQQLPLTWPLLMVIDFELLWLTSEEPMFNVLFNCPR